MVIDSGTPRIRHRTIQGLLRTGKSGARSPDHSGGFKQRGENCAGAGDPVVGGRLVAYSQGPVGTASAPVWRNSSRRDVRGFGDGAYRSRLAAPLCDPGGQEERIIIFGHRAECGRTESAIRTSDCALEPQR